MTDAEKDKVVRLARIVAGMYGLDAEAESSIHNAIIEGAGDAFDERDALVDEVRRLREALKPFAAIEVQPDALPDGWMATWCNLDTFPTVAAVRHAADLLAPAPAVETLPHLNPPVVFLPGTVGA